MILSTPSCQEEQVQGNPAMFTSKWGPCRTMFNTILSEKFYRIFDVGNWVWVWRTKLVSRVILAWKVQLRSGGMARRSLSLFARVKNIFFKTNCSFCECSAVAVFLFYQGCGTGGPKEGSQATISSGEHHPHLGSHLVQCCKLQCIANIKYCAFYCSNYGKSLKITYLKKEFLCCCPLRFIRNRLKGKGS